MAMEIFLRGWIKLVFIFAFGFKPFFVMCSTLHENTEESPPCNKGENGRTADPHNCCNFIECSNNQRKSCPLGLMFNRTLELCDWPEKVHCQVQIQELAEGDWINGVYTGCHVLNNINKLRDTVFNRQTNTIEVLEELNNMTSPQRNKTLTENALMTSLYTLLGLVEFANVNGSHVTAGVTIPPVPIESSPRMVYEIASNLLDSGNIATWREIDSKTPPNTVISRLVKVLDDYGLQVASEMQGDESFNTILTDNLAATIIKSNHHMKKLENESCFNLQESSVCLPGRIFSNNAFGGAVNIIYYTLNQVLLLEAPNVAYPAGTHSNGFSTLRTHHPIQSVIVSSTVSPSLQQTLNQSVRIVLENRYNSDLSMERTCVFWEYENPVNTWSTRGCRVVHQEYTNNVTSCLCTHLTLFAVLMDPYDVEVPRTHQRALELISTAGCSVSLLALTCTMLVTAIFWRNLKTVGTKVLLNLCLALAASCVLVIVADAAREHEILCKLIAVSLHFIVMSVFSWMLCEGILLYYITTPEATDHEDKVKYFCLLGWGFPTSVVMVTLAVTRVHGYGRGKSRARTCWLTVDNGLIWVFITPALIVILINIVFMIIVVKRTLSTQLMLARTHLQRVRAGVKAVLASLPLLGITWSFGLLSFNSDTVYFKYLFAIFNSLQGLMIFVFHCVLNRKVQEIFMLKITRFKQRSVVTARVKPAPT